MAIHSTHNHENLVKFTEAFEFKEQQFIVSEYQHGGDMVDYIKKHWNSGSIPEEMVKTLSFEIAKGLQYLHGKKTAHRDIKPENIVLSVDSKHNATAKIVDFGSAIKLEKKKSTHQIIGTLPFIAPEVLDGKHYDYSCDIWSFGCMLYGMLSGEHPLLTITNLNFDIMR